MDAENRKKRILCVEDHQDTCEMIALLLKDYEVVGAYSLAEGLRRATSESFDLYLLDYNLPDGTGLELCLFIRGFDRETPIVLCTAGCSITERQVLTTGAQGFIKKGVGFVDHLMEAASRLLAAA